MYPRTWYGLKWLVTAPILITAIPIAFVIEELLMPLGRVAANVIEGMIYWRNA